MRNSNHGREPDGAAEYRARYEAQQQAFIAQLHAKTLARELARQQAEQQADEWVGPMTKTDAAKRRYPDLPRRRALRNLQRDIDENLIRYRQESRSAHYFGAETFG